VLFGLIFLVAAPVDTILQYAVIRLHGRQSLLASPVGADVRGEVAIALYLAAIGSAFVADRVSISLHVVAACMWLIPDQRIERLINHQSANVVGRAVRRRVLRRRRVQISHRCLEGAVETHFVSKTIGANR